MSNFDLSKYKDLCPRVSLKPDTTHEIQTKVIRTQTHREHLDRTSQYTKMPLVLIRDEFEYDSSAEFAGNPEALKK